MGLRYNSKNSTSNYKIRKPSSNETDLWFSPEVLVPKVMRYGKWVDVVENNNRIFKMRNVAPPAPLDCVTRY